MGARRRRGLDGLLGGIVRLVAAMERDRGEWAQALDAFARRFHVHSARNRLLIWRKRPGATMVRGRIVAVG